MIATVPSRDMGMARMTFRVLDRDPRNIQQTRAVSMIDISSSNWISLTESLMNCVLSKTTLAVMPSGRVLRRSSRAARARAATPTALAPRCFFRLMPWAGPPLTRAMRRTSSNPSSTRLTSLR